MINCYNPFKFKNLFNLFILC